MAYLLLNFAGKSETGSERVQDFYNKSLKEQYEALAIRYAELKRLPYEQFVQACFPTSEAQYYYISMPNFLRDDGEDTEARYFNNIVIRATKNAASRNILPNGLEMILIGDISMRFGEFDVKGIELIDGSIYKYGEKELYATAACAFSNRSGINRPDYGFRLEADTSALTRDFILRMCEQNYTVADPAKVLRTYDKWSAYIHFREYYLNEQGKDGIQFDECEAIKCYGISRRDYENSPEEYKEYLLEGLDAGKRGEQILVTKKFENSEIFELVKVTLDKNKKELFSKTVKNKGEMPEFEQKLQRFTRQDISLVNGSGKHSVSVDDRYNGLYFKDIEPDYSYIEAKFAENLKDEYTEIDTRYAAIRKQRVSEYMAKKTAELEGADAAVLVEYEKELTENLVRDVSENKDEAMHRVYAAEVKTKEDIVRTQAAKTKKQYEEKITVSKKNKDKLKDEEVAMLVKKLEGELADELVHFDNEIAKQKEMVSLRGLYEARNERLIAKKKTDLKATREVTLRLNQKGKMSETASEQEPKIREEKATAKRTNAENLAAKKADMKDNQTFRRYYIYFKLRADETSDKVNEDIKKYNPTILKFDQRADGAKINRQKKSLQYFFGGYVKNPFLSSYLFAPRELGDVGTELPDIEYFSPRLNEKQQEAVRKAIASESIFLLQGPPGTGKTEVIAEITAQYVQRGKRILISSETHKAIDNVFERLPKIPEIRPLRLIPSQSKKDPSPYSPERLVDNFYINISDRLGKEVDRFKHFSANKEKFDEDYKVLRIEHQKLNREKTRIQNVEISLDRIKRERMSLTDRHDAENEKLRQIQERQDTLKRRLRNMEGLDFADAEDATIQDTGNLLLEYLVKYPILKQDLQTPAVIHRVDINRIKEEIASLSGNSKMIGLEAKRAKLKKKMADLRNPDTEEIIKGREEEYKTLQSQLIAVSTKIHAAKKTSDIDVSDLMLTKIVNEMYLRTDTLDTLVEMLLEIKGELVKITTMARETIGGEIDAKTNEFNTQKAIMDDLKGQIRDKDNEAQATKDDGDYEEYKKIESRLKRKITEFFETFDIVEPYEDIAEALEIIRVKWEDLERNYEEREQENKEKIPMYERILKFLRKLQRDGTIETDRMDYTKKLFENANVYGLTCTSRDHFKTDSMESFKKYALDDLDIKKQGIDVVIIDEVSKSSFLDLLIPILYGKTVILVGDHRQLPPMYDLRHMKEDEFEGLDPDVITKKRNDEYTELYEECFFKTLFESVPERLRVTLTKQYRCHGDIMKVFNHFYGDSLGRGGLELGLPNQNDQKQHGLLVKNKSGKPVIDRDKHIYFVNCGDTIDGYEKFGDSTSATNEREAKVIIELAKRIDEACGKLPKQELDKPRGIDKRMSMGVICTYGDQAKQIRRKLQKSTLKNICELQEERFIVSTVDDFQGDERDIIFVSMVRNPEPKNRKRTRAEFVKKFERINVALSRARRMLIIVGSKDFLSEAAIDLPDMSGNRALDRHAYPIYRKIIETISIDGLLLKASDVLWEDK